MTAAGPSQAARVAWRREFPGAGLELRRLGHQLHLHRRWWLCPHRSHTPLLLLATYRSGSSLLRDYLRSLPGVQCLAEVLSPRLAIGPPWPDLTARQALRHLRRSLQALTAPIRGCELMLDQLASCQLSPADLARAFPQAKCVVLYRQALAEQLLSGRFSLGENEGRVSSGAAPRQARVALDPVELRCYCDQTRRMYQELLAHRWLCERSVLLSYEELTVNPRACFAERICPLLGVPAAELPANLPQHRSQSPSHQVANDAEIAAVVDSPQFRQHYAWPHEHAGGHRAA